MNKCDKRAEGCWNFFILTFYWKIFLPIKGLHGLIDEGMGYWFPWTNGSGAHIYYNLNDNILVLPMDVMQI